MRLCEIVLAPSTTGVLDKAYRQGREHNRIDQSGHAHANSPPSDAEAIPLGSQVTGKDLRGYQERDSSPGGSITVRRHQVSIGG